MNDNELGLMAVQSQTYKNMSPYVRESTLTRQLITFVDKPEGSTQPEG